MIELRQMLSKALLGVALFYPAGAHAHVRWFVDNATAETHSFEPYTVSEPTVLAWGLIAVALMGIAIFLDLKLPTLAVPNTKLRHDVMELMRVLTGMSLLLTAYEGNLIAPHLQATGGFGLVLVILQTFVGILLLSNHFLHHAAIPTKLIYSKERANPK